MACPQSRRSARTLGRREREPEQSQGGVVRGTRVRNEVKDSIVFGCIIQGASINVTLPPRVEPALAGLRASARVFVGRQAECDALLAELAPRRPQAGEPGPVAVVNGLPGVGKTELVLRVAHRACARPGWFEGGVLFVDLRGYEPESRVSAALALGSLLHSLGIPQDIIPADAQARERLYHSVLDAYARQGRRILVVVDNASSAEQVRPLLPGDSHTPALVTSRHTLSDLGNATLHRLDTLDDADSVDLLRRRIRHQHGTHDTRVDDEPEAAAAVARRCGHLPLALGIIAALLADTPGRSLADLAADLADRQRRLDELTREDASVRAVFDLSYAGLPAEQAKVFRLLSLAPGPDAGTATVAELTALEQRTVKHALHALQRAGLVETGRTSLQGDVRWTQHRLVRLYAQERARAEEGFDALHDAFERLLRYVEERVDAFTPEGLANDTAPFQDLREGLHWLAEERRALTALGESAADCGHPGAIPRCLHLSYVLLAFLLVHGRGEDDVLDVTEAAVSLARRQSDSVVTASALITYGDSLFGAGRSAEAVVAYREALELLRVAGGTPDEPTALHNLGLALSKRGEEEAALACLEQARELYEAAGDLSGTASALESLGSVHSRGGRHEAATTAFQRSIDMFDELGETRRATHARIELGIGYRAAEQHHQAIAMYNLALSCLRPGDHRRRRRVLHLIGDSQIELGNFQMAIDAYTEAAECARDSGSEFDEHLSMLKAATALRRAGRRREARRVHKKALRARLGGDVRRAAHGARQLASDALFEKRYGEAARYWMAAEYLLEETGNEDDTAVARELRETSESLHRRDRRIWAGFGLSFALTMLATAGWFFSFGMNGLFIGMGLFAVQGAMLYVSERRLR
ncbi:tetratricopeptide repeat protein [Streptomyces pacificus]|uniref:Tetratricopeptide repeat protein n=1 Tax=Streptomyces pacificus TaxID=2705029 RepID=A0A6A0B0Z1_9ACTN|nr:tetratricopeptide repeat protein [Streptomyces pacificus]